MLKKESEVKDEHAGEFGTISGMEREETKVEGNCRK